MEMHLSFSSLKEEQFIFVREIIYVPCVWNSHNRLPMKMSDFNTNKLMTLMTDLRVIITKCSLIGNIGDPVVMLRS